LNFGHTVGQRSKIGIIFRHGHAISIGNGCCMSLSEQLAVCILRSRKKWYAFIQDIICALTGRPNMKKVFDDIKDGKQSSGDST